MPGLSYHSPSIPELISKRAREQPDDPAVYTGVPTEDPTKLLQPISYANLEKAIDRLAWHYSSIPNLLPSPSSATSLPPVRIVSVITTTAIDETLLEIALTKLGLTALLLSVNNSVPAIAHLTKLTQSHHIIYGAKFADEVKEAKELLAAEGWDVELIPERRFRIWGEDGMDEELVRVKPFRALLTPEQERERPAVVLHSSGSTGFPKPVYVTHTGLIANAALNQNKNGFSTLPVFHGYGHFALFRCFYAGKRITLFPPHLPLTSANICRVIQASPDVRQCYAVPYVIKLLGETEQGTTALADFDVVSYAGAALPDDLGDRLTSRGVNILSIYGTTETGSLMNSQRAFEDDKEWNWLRILNEEYLVFEPRGEDTYEIVVKDGYPPKIETNRPDGSYATKDLFVSHKTRKGLYKYVGRLDDTLVQTLGEKTNPVPIELAIRGNSPYVSEAIVFGAGRPQTGVLILPSPLAHAERLTAQQVFDKAWPAIEGANKEAPSHSRILPEMVEVLPYGTEIPVATKMSILRPACYAKFKELIDTIYTRFESSTGLTKITPSPPELESLLLNLIASVVGPTKAKGLTKDVDLFTFGVDSLQGARIRNSICKTVELGEGGVLGQNVVYEYPSVTKLARHILDVQAGASGAQLQVEGEKELMLELVEKYASQLVKRAAPTRSVPEPGHVVVLTGASGSLGAHILAQLTASPSVKKVVCLTRASTHAESSKRLEDSLKQRKLVLTEDQQSKVVSFAANANDDNLSLTTEEYEGLKNEATIVIHNAWPVNFNISLSSYDVHIKGALNLLNLALSSPLPITPAFYFSSSISCRQGSSDLTCTEEYAENTSTAAGTGYARSKWVVEKLCQRAAASAVSRGDGASGSDQAGLNVGVLRIGQMVGDTVHGVWNETEAWPLMFKGANTMGYLPLGTSAVSWLPVDYAGLAISQIVLQPTPAQSRVYHIVNPHLTAWSDIIEGLRDAGVRYQAVEPMEYVRKLEESEQDGERNPVFKLLPFFKGRYAGGEKKPMVFLTCETEKVAPGIGASPPVTRELVSKWVRHWREVGFLASD